MPVITVSMLLNSCAMPPVSWPTASIFWAWISCSSAARFWVTSLTKLLMRVRPPSWSAVLDASIRISSPFRCSRVASNRMPIGVSDSSGSSRIMRCLKPSRSGSATRRLTTSVPSASLRVQPVKASA
ncbi:hypothetical protein ACVWWK_003409 [Bradyrhizobium sp. LB9.1b]